MLDIVFEDAKIIVCHKPAGVLSQGNRSFDVDMVSQVLAYRRQKGEDCYCAIINRLDRPVEGLVLFAKDKTTAARLSKEMGNDTLNKMYYCLAHNEFAQSCGTLRNYLIRDAKSQMARVVDGPCKDAKEAVLDYQVLAVREGVSLVRVQLHTGRFHQIRAQLAHIGNPLVGDGKYGSDASYDGIALCAYSVTVGGRVITTVPKHPKLREFQEYF